MIRLKKWQFTTLTIAFVIIFGIYITYYIFDGDFSSTNLSSFLTLLSNSDGNESLTDMDNTDVSSDNNLNNATNNQNSSSAGSSTTYTGSGKNNSSNGSTNGNSNQGPSNSNGTLGNSNQGSGNGSLGNNSGNNNSNSNGTLGNSGGTNGNGSNNGSSNNNPNNGSNIGTNGNTSGNGSNGGIKPGNNNGAGSNSDFGNGDINYSDESDNPTKNEYGCNDDVADTDSNIEDNIPDGDSLGNSDNDNGNNNSDNTSDNNSGSDSSNTDSDNGSNNNSNSGESDNTSTDDKFNYSNINNLVNIKNYGAKGDGVTDDSKVINKVLNSGVKNVYFPPGIYRCVERIEINSINNVNLYGQGNESIIATDSSYTGGSNPTENFFTIWECNNISFNNLCIKAREKWTVPYSRQMAIYYSNNVSFYGCSFIVPSTVKDTGKNTDREYTNIMCYTGWKNITIKNCYFEQLGGVERGSNIILTDIWNEGCDNASIVNNTFYHNAHDEMFSLFGGKESSSHMKNISVYNNIFNAQTSKDVSDRTMGFTFAYTDSKNVSDVTFNNNLVNATIPGSLMTFGVIKNCVITNNNINITSTTAYNTGIVFSGTEGVTVKSNDISINSNSTNGMAIVACGDMVFSYNKLTINSSMNCLFSETTANNNTVTVNAYCQAIAQAPRLMSGNTININKLVDNLITFVQITLTHQSVIKQNVFNYNHNDSDISQSLLTGNAIYINIGTSLRGNKVSFVNNTINAPHTTATKRMLAYCIVDSTSQSITIANNNSRVFTGTTYLGEGARLNLLLSE